MKYELMNPPFEMKKYSEMSKNEADVHFEWYLSQIPIRLGQLNQAFQLENKLNNLDFSRESLGPLWTWYLSNVKVERKSNQELNQEIANSNEMTKHNIRETKINIGWMSVAIDIGIYFSEVMIRNNEELCWGIECKPKSLMSVNKPVVVGFGHKMTMDSSNLLSVQTRKILKKTQRKDALLNLYDNWVKHIDIGN